MLIGMDLWNWVQIVAAVILANAVSAGYFFAAVRCYQLQKRGAKDDQLPWWVYAWLLVAPAIVAAGAYGLT